VQRHEREAYDGDHGQPGHRGLGRPGRQHQFEQRHRIAELALPRSERAVAPADDQRDPLDAEGADGESQADATAARQRTGPHLGQRRQLDDGDGGVERPEPPGGRPQRRPVRRAAPAAARTSNDVIS
jgi:hypothetical protein